MTPEAKAFKQKFTRKQWQLLKSIKPLKAAWDSGDLVKAGEMAAPILKLRAAFEREFKNKEVPSHLSMPQHDRGKNPNINN